MQRWTVDLHLPVYGAWLGAPAGLVVGGVGSRLAMRVVTLRLGAAPSITVEGTAGILVMGLLLGMAFGTAYGFIRSIAAIPKWSGALLFGLFLFSAFVAMPMLSAQPGDELALLPPVEQMLLFGWIPFIYAAAVALPLDRRARTAPAQARRPAPLRWVGLFGLALVMAFAGMTSLMNDRVRAPLDMRGMMELAGAGFGDVGTILGLIGVLFGLLYCGLAVAILYHGYAYPAALRTAVLLLLFAALAFNTGDYWQSLVRQPVLHPWWRGLGLAAALGLLLATVVLVRSGVGFPPLSRIVVWLWGFGLVAVLLLIGSGLAGRPLDASQDSRPLWGEWLLWLVTGVLLVGAGSSLGDGRRATGQGRRQARVTMLGFVATALLALLIWALILLLPDWQLRRQSALGTVLSVPLYLLPWLLWPSAIVMAMGRYGLWRAPVEAMPPASSGAERGRIAVKRP